LQFAAAGEPGSGAAGGEKSSRIFPMNCAQALSLKVSMQKPPLSSLSAAISARVEAANASVYGWPARRVVCPSML
jgi:hypothetical protein